MQVVFEQDHDEALDWHDWVLRLDEIELRAKDGTRRGSTTEFVAAGCNNPECSARALARVDDLNEIVAAALVREPASA
ncbi:MAG: hypothetical protein M3O70_08745 [Actinomycetota bacterium]|nr:hypothetical protein [Actinomycetota bacterium]